MTAPLLLDTHVLVGWFNVPRALSRSQERALAAAVRRGPVLVSDISLWEIALLLERGRIRIDMPLDAWLERLTAEPRVKRCAISPTVVKEMVDLAVTRPWDPADRILVATARVLGAKLVTSDERIVESELVQTVC